MIDQPQQLNRLRRRDVLIGLSSTAILLRTRMARASEPARIGFISGGDEEGASAFIAALREGLAAEGYTEPATLHLDRLYADYSLDRIPEMVAELERRRNQVIVTHAAATPIVVKSKRSVPVVYEFSADPVSTGIAEDLAHPLFNATGVTLLRAELNSKRLEFLREILPRMQRVAVIFNPLHPGEDRERADLAAEAEQLGIHLSFFATPNRVELDRALEAIKGRPTRRDLGFLGRFCRRESCLNHQFCHEP